MKQILTYHVAGMALIPLCNTQNILLRRIQDNELESSLSSLFANHPNQIQVTAPLNCSLMILGGFSNAELDQFLANCKQRNIRCDYKAILTPYNASWSVSNLAKELEKEAKEMKKK